MGEMGTGFEEDYLVYKKENRYRFMLESRLSERDYFELLSVLLEVGIPSKSVQSYQPWYVSTMVDQVLSSRLGIRPEYGIDFYFRSKAGQKEIKELESVEAQLQLLASLSDHEQVLMTFWAVEDLEHAAEDFNELLQVWQHGDIEAMEQQLQKEFQEEPRFKPIWNMMVERRNLAMADRIVTFMREQTSVILSLLGRRIWWVRKDW